MASVDYSLVKKILSDNGYSWTKPREAVFRVVSSSSPVAISFIIKKLDKKVDRVSVYRTIELFESLGVVHRINIGWKYKLELSDPFVSHHHHLVCVKCGKVIDIEDEKHIDSFINSLAKQFEFQPQRHQFEIEGLCKACSLKQ